MFSFSSWKRAEATRSAPHIFNSLNVSPARRAVTEPHITQRCQANISSLSLILPVYLVTSLSSVVFFLQSLLTGLMYYRPDDPIDYLEGCLKKVRELGGPDKVRWDTFVGQEKKSLPPLNGGQSRRSLFRNGEQ